MTEPLLNKRLKQARVLRIFRKVHRFTGVMLFIFFFFIAVTGILLGWKKHSDGLILAKSYSGSSTDFKDWLPMDSLHKNAQMFLRENAGEEISTDVSRIDVRAEKGMIKFMFKDHYWAVQLDGATGEMLFLESRRADFIESIHDGSILDHYFGTTDEQLKLIYTSVMGTALLTFTITGFWLWYGPKRMRRR